MNSSDGYLYYGPKGNLIGSGGYDLTLYQLADVIYCDGEIVKDRHYSLSEPS